VGSVSGGGRYDNLTGAFGDRDNLSGVGFSFGVDRIYDAMEELKLFPADTTAVSKILICHFDQDTYNYGLGILSEFRRKGISSELFPDHVKLKKQLDYANKKGIPFCVVIGPDEMKSGLFTLKNMQTGEQRNVTREQLTDALL
jgi:histidyl-tRNA synthetase